MIGLRLLRKYGPWLLAAGLTQACSQTDEPELPPCYVPVAESPTRGPADAWVTVVEFGDFECPYCGRAEPTIREVDAQRPGVVRWVWKHYPLQTIHPRALPAAIAAECAHAQGYFWEMHDLLFANQSAQSDADLATFAQQIGLDMTTWQTCLNSGTPQLRIAADVSDGTAARVDGTPTFFVNGTAVVGAVPLGDLLSAVDTAAQSAMASGTAAPAYYAAHEGEGCQ